MKQIVMYTILLMSLLLVGCASRAAHAQTPEEPVFVVTTRHGDDEVTLDYLDHTTTIEIKSPFGIGAAVFKLSAGQMPDHILLRLHLKGLEELQLIAKEQVIYASVSSSAGLKAQSQSKISGNNEQALGSSDAWWLDIRIMPEVQSIPLQDGYFEVSIPPAFVQHASDSFEIRWVDFYR